MTSRKMARKRVAPIATVVILALFSELGSVLPAGADIYSYRDENGVIHFSNVPTDLRYRFKIREEEVDVYLIEDPSLRYEPIIRRASVRHRMGYPLIKAVIKAESNFNPSLVSRAGACGLMQLMPETAREMGVSQVFDPEQNIEGGCRYLRKLLDRFDGDLILALAAYNAGARPVLEHDGVPPFPETERFIERVLDYEQQYKSKEVGSR